MVGWSTSKGEATVKKQPYRIVGEESTASSGELADWLAKDGQLLIPPVELLEKGERAIYKVIDVMGRATVEAILQMSAEQVAGPKARGRLFVIDGAKALRQAIDRRSARRTWCSVVGRTRSGTS